MGKPQTVLSEGASDEMTSTVVEEALRRSIKPVELKVGIVKMRRTRKGIAITAKDEEDMRMIEAAIKKNVITRKSVNQKTQESKSESITI